MTEERDADNVDEGVVALAEALFLLIVGPAHRVVEEFSLTALSTMARLLYTGPRRITDLALAEGLRQPSMSALVKGLERSGLVERRSHDHDKRVVLVALTPAGEEVLVHARQTGVDAMARLIEKLPPDQARALVAARPALVRLREIDLDGREK
jgi:DNA-binding MarR family transcriptional regulator